MARRAGPALLAALLALAPGARAQDGTPGVLRLADWRGSFLGRGASGRLCLLAAPDGTCRAEVAEGAKPLADLLERRGEGWTLVLPAQGDAVLQPWGREWRRLGAGPGAGPGGDPGTDPGAGLRAVAAALATPPAVREGARRVLLPPAGPAPGFRAALAARGRGRGGPGETLVIRRQDDADGTSVSVRSSRRPGTLAFGNLRCLPVRYAPDEAFVPLWPLRDLLETGHENPGTCPPAGG